MLVFPFLKTTCYKITAVLIACAFLVISNLATAADVPDGKIKVFILTGQSNMEGKGSAHHLDTYKNDPLIKGTYNTIKKDGKWVVRNDVWITYPTKRGGGQKGGLTVGYGTKGKNSIGPEFGFGHTVGESIKEPVLIIKVAWGGKSLAVDFYPPSAGKPSKDKLQALLKRSQRKRPKTTMADIKARYGHFYRELVKKSKKSLANIGNDFPELKGRKYEIAGIVWHQGFNDIINKDLRSNQYADYTKWLGMFIKDLRKDLDAPNAPFIIGELSTGGIAGRGDFQKAQAATANLPGLKGNVVFVPTAEYYDTKALELFKKKYWKGTPEQQKEWNTVGNDRPYHYLGSGKCYYLKGKAFGKAVLKKLK